MPPIYATSTYVQASPGVHQGYEYSRTQNPTRMAYERCLADLESGTHGFAFASGMAAIGTILELVDSGGHVVAMDDLYGGTRRLFDGRAGTQCGTEFTYIDMTDAGTSESALQDEHAHGLDRESRAIRCSRSSTSPPFRKWHAAGTSCSFATTPLPHLCLQRPLELGCDIVMHSATKFLNGHSDMVGGIVATGDDERREKLAYLQNSIGAVAGPFDSFLALRGLKTLDVRMERHCRSAAAIAEWLQSDPRVERVLYPGLASHPQHALAARQMSASAAS